MIFKPGHEPVVPAVDLPPACAPGRRATMLAGIYAAVTALLIMTTQAMLQGWPVLLVIAISSFVLFLVMRRELLGAAGNATAGQATAATSSHNNTCFTEALEKVPHVL